MVMVLKPHVAGRRACLGESLAKMELFMFFVTLLQRYNVRLPEGSTATDSSVVGIINAPKPYELVFTLRWLNDAFTDFTC